MRTAKGIGIGILNILIGLGVICFVLWLVMAEDIADSFRKGPHIPIAIVFGLSYVFIGFAFFNNKKWLSKFGLLISAIGLGFIYYVVWIVMEKRISSDIFTTVSSFLALPLGLTWIIIGYGLISGKKWLKGKCNTLLWGIFGIIIFQIILLFISSDPGYDYKFNDALKIIFFESICYLTLLLPMLKSNQVTNPD